MTPVKLLCHRHGGYTNNKLKGGSKDVKRCEKKVKRKKVELQLHASGKQCPNFPTNSWIVRFSRNLNTLRCPAIKDAAFATKYSGNSRESG